MELLSSEAIQTVLGLDNDLTERIMSDRMGEQEMAAADRAVLESTGRLLDAMTGAVPSDFIRRLIMVLTDELCDRLCAAAREKSRELGIDISFAVSDEHGLPRVYRRYGQALALSVTLVPGKAYTAAVTQCSTKDVAGAAAEGAPLVAIQTNDPRITLVAGGYPLFVKGRIAGGIGVGGGTEAQDCEIAEYVLSVFEGLTA